MVELFDAVRKVRIFHEKRVVACHFFQDGTRPLKRNHLEIKEMLKIKFANHELNFQHSYVNQHVTLQQPRAAGGSGYGRSTNFAPPHSIAA